MQKRDFNYRHLAAVCIRKVGHPVIFSLILAALGMQIKL